ncbi:MAG: tyrosine-type recombinase/integrase [Actinomycetota bacterium]|nr:tyrosine-type recombinase/integrase [Actinomycetota bacterium]
MAKIEKPFVGEFRVLLEAFVEHKRALGYKYETDQQELQRFSIFTLNYRVEDKVLSKQLVMDWTSKRKNESAKRWAHRCSDLRQFALYLQNLGYDAFIPPGCHKVNRGEYIPYIFTHNEIARFLQVVDSIKPHPLSNKHASYPLLFRLLYCCGLRISEALRLKISDVDFDKGVLFIRESKFGKDRLIPISAPLANMFGRYHALFNRNNAPEDYYFRNKNGTPLTHDRIYKVYRALLWKTGISHGGKGKGPRLHDLRHVFCVHSLAKQVKAGIDLYVALPTLSTYVGHSSITATQRYVRLTAEAYPELLEKVSRTCAYVFPEVTKDETD